MAKTKHIPIGGRSLLINALLIFLNLIGVAFIVMGAQDYFESFFILFNFIGFSLLILTITGVILFKGKLMFSLVARWILGSVLIVSGLVKANDPVGFSYKLAEYFEDGALAYRIKTWFNAPEFSFEYLIDSALSIGIFLCVLEIVLGIFLLIGGKIRWVSSLTVLTLLFFTFLTWHTANCDAQKKYRDVDTYPLHSSIAQEKLKQAKTNTQIRIVAKTAEEIKVQEYKTPQCVSDCGCFGDALKGSVGRSLTPNESLWKDLVLLYLAIWVFLAQKLIQPNTVKQNLYLSLYSMILIAFFSWVFSWVFLVIFIIILWLGALWVRRAGGVVLGNYFGSLLFSVLFSGGFITYVLLYQPVKDYGPYAVGSHLKWKTLNGKAGVYQNVFVLKNLKTGQEQTYTEKEYLDPKKKIWENPNLKFLRMDQKVIRAAKLPSITDQFNPEIAVSALEDWELKLPFIQDFLPKQVETQVVLRDLTIQENQTIPLSNYDTIAYPLAQYQLLDTLVAETQTLEKIQIRDFLFQAPEVMVLVARHLSGPQVNWNAMSQIKAIQQYCYQNNIPFLIITSASTQDITQFRKKYALKAPVFINDETEIKIMSRSNPGLLILKKGVVKGKFSHRELPTVEWLKKNKR